MQERFTEFRQIAFHLFEKALDLFEHFLKLLRREAELIHDAPVDCIERLTDAEKKEVEEFVERFDVAGALDQSRAQGVAKQQGSSMPSRARARNASMLSDK